MISYARQTPEEQTDVVPPPADDHIAPAPRVSVQAFCENVETAAMVQARAGAAELAVRATAALAVCDGSKSIAVDQHAQRLAREAVKTAGSRRQ